MIDLTPTARMRLNSYLDELRRVFSGSAAVDPTEVERDVRDHIDTALAQYPAPVDEGILNQVLDELGSPAQWLPGEERPWYGTSRGELIALARQRVKRSIQVVTGWPESHRLAYLSLLVLALGWFCLVVSQNDDVGPFVVLATLVSFILSRAALSRFGAAQLTSGQKWLLYPSLVSVYLVLAAVLLFGAGVVSCVSLFVNAERLFGKPLTTMTALWTTAGVVGMNWLLLGLLIMVSPGIVRNVFHPFAVRLTRWSGVGLTTIGVLMSVIAVTWFRWL